MKYHNSISISVIPTRYVVFRAFQFKNCIFNFRIESIQIKSKQITKINKKKSLLYVHITDKLSTYLNQAAHSVLLICCIEFSSVVLHNSRFRTILDYMCMCIDWITLYFFFSSIHQWFAPILRTQNIYYTDYSIYIVYFYVN